MIKLGLNLYRSMLTPENFQFARQAGATHIVAHLVDYFNKPDSRTTASGKDAWGVTTNQDKLWTYEELRDLKTTVNNAGLALAAIENFDPSHWYDILLDGENKQKQMEGLKTIIRNMGKAGIPIIGYNFSIAGVWGRTEVTRARGGATSVGYNAAEAPEEIPIPNGTVWNMIYDPDAPEGYLNPISRDEMWERFSEFLAEILPVAEEAGVRLAMHPDDPPLPSLRGMGRLIYQHEHYRHMLTLAPSPANALEFCIGTLAEMTEGDLYETIDYHSQRGDIGYIHFRNVIGKVPNYYEVFIDEGDIDMLRVLRILKKNNFDGVLVPDHTPQMTCDAPWHAGMAYALGWMRAAIMILEQP